MPGEPLLNGSNINTQKTATRLLKHSTKTIKKIVREWKDQKVQSLRSRLRENFQEEVETNLIFHVFRIHGQKLINETLLFDY